MVSATLHRVGEGLRGAEGRRRGLWEDPKEMKMSSDSMYRATSEGKATKFFEPLACAHLHNFTENKYKARRHTGYKARYPSRKERKVQAVFHLFFPREFWLWKTEEVGGSGQLD